MEYPMEHSMEHSMEQRPAKWRQSVEARHRLMPTRRTVDGTFDEMSMECFDGMFDGVTDGTATCEVLPDCRSSPLTNVRRSNLEPSTSELGTIHGPRGQNVSRLLPIELCSVELWHIEVWPIEVWPI